MKQLSSAQGLGPKNKDHKYVPSNLLELWGLEVKGES
jgi:hypothetical protein